jgi:hypothetical protein
MTRFSMALIVVSLACANASAQGLKRHVDDRTGTAALVPSDWRPSPSDPNWEGVRFFSRDGDSWLAVWGKNSGGQSTGAYQSFVGNAAGDNVTYARRGTNWFVVSGYRGDRIFYVKAVRRCTRDQWHHIAFEYPAAQKRAYDRLVTAVSHSLGAECG